MKRLLEVLVAALSLAALQWGCASMAARVGREPGPPGIDQAVVTALVCEGKPADAKVYVTQRGGQDADVTERIERAKAAIAEGKAKSDPKYSSCCDGDKCPAAH